MPTYNNTLMTTRMGDVRTAINAGAAGGKVKIYTAAYGTLLGTFTLATDCGSVAGDPATLTLDCGTGIDTTGAADGVPAIARITDSDDNMVGEGYTVGTSGTHFIVSVAQVTTGGNLTLESGAIQHGSS